MNRYRPRGLHIWLALLTLLAVFAATAGAREAIASRTQAVRQTLAATTHGDQDDHRLGGLE